MGMGALFRASRYPQLIQSVHQVRVIVQAVASGDAQRPEQ
jgi:hypothetical protein